MLLFSDCYAHPGDSLPLHLERVAARAGASVAPTAWPAIRAIARVGGLLHDSGKATPWFQAYLLQQGPRSALTYHAELGALLAWWYTAQLAWPLWQRLAVFLAIRRHHGPFAFQAWPDLFEQTRDHFRDPAQPLAAQAAALDSEGIRRWLSAVSQRQPAWRLTAPEAVPSSENLGAALHDRRLGASKLRRAYTELNEALATLAGFGAVLAVDKTDAALQGATPVRQALPAAAVAVYKQRRWGAEKAALTALDERREAIAERVAATWLAHPEQALFTLTAPTGAGKTLTILHAALQWRAAREAATGHAPRIIYCLPFTSVIDQNHAVMRAVVRSNGLPEREAWLLKHHHLTTSLFRAADREHQPDGAGQLLTETWQSELVVTTFHQLLHTVAPPASRAYRSGSAR